MGPSLRTALLLWFALAPAVGAQAPPDGGAVDGGPLHCALVDPEPGARAAPSLGPVRVLVVRARFADDLDEPPTTDAEAISAWFDRVSYGAVQFGVTVSPVVELSRPRSDYAAAGDTYGTGEWVSETAALLEELGLPTSAFDIVSVLARRGAPFDLGRATGIAALGGRRTWSTDGSLLVMVHEIGHTMSLLHANRKAVEDGDPFAGELLAYAHPFDVMGNRSTGDFTATAKARLGWVPPRPSTTDMLAADPTFDPVQGGTLRVRLNAIDNGRHPADAAGLALHLPDRYQVPRLEAEVREGVPGVLLYSWVGNSSSNLFDATPGALASDSSYHLPPGGRFAFSDFFPGGAAEVAVEVTAVAADGAWADVAVHLGRWEAADVAPEIHGMLVSPGLEVSLGASATLTAEATAIADDPLTVDFLVEGVWRPVQGPPFRMTWQPTAPGAYSVRARASSRRGQSAATPAQGVLFRDPTAPPPTAVGQVGTVRLQSGAWTHMEFANPLASPTVVAQVVGDVPSERSNVVQLRNVGDQGFEVRAPALEQPAVVAYVAVSAGAHRLLDGSVLHAGAADADGAWQRVRLPVPGASPPAVFAGAAAGSSDDVVRARFRDIGREGFDVQPADGPALGRIGYLAFAPSLLPTGTLNRRMEVGSLALDAGQGVVELRQSYGSGPGVLLTSVQTSSALAPFDVVMEATGPASARAHTAGSAPAEARVAFVALGFSAYRTEYTSLRGVPIPVAEVPSVDALGLTLSPNPTAGASVLTVDLPSAADLTVVVVDVLGREVARVAAGTRPGGTYAVPLPASLAAGSYLVHVRAGSDRRTTRLTVTR